MQPPPLPMFHADRTADPVSGVSVFAVVDAEVIFQLSIAKPGPSLTWTRFLSNARRVNSGPDPVERLASPSCF